ncbi:hypothetical protein Tco_0315669 [Tanacetum coccineum]
MNISKTSKTLRSSDDNTTLSMLLESQSYCQSKTPVKILTQGPPHIGPIVCQRCGDHNGILCLQCTKISRIVKTLVLAVFHKSFTSSASFWESILWLPSVVYLDYCRISAGCQKPDDLADEAGIHRDMVVHGIDLPMRS